MSSILEKFFKNVDPSEPTALVAAALAGAAARRRIARSWERLLGEVLDECRAVANAGGDTGPVLRSLAGELRESADHLDKLAGATRS